MDCAHGFEEWTSNFVYLTIPYGYIFGKYGTRRMKTCTIGILGVALLKFILFASEEKMFLGKHS